MTTAMHEAAKMRATPAIVLFPSIETFAANLRDENRATRIAQIVLLLLLLFSGMFAPWFNVVMVPVCSLAALFVLRRQAAKKREVAKRFDELGPEWRRAEPHGEIRDDVVAQIADLWRISSGCADIPLILKRMQRSGVEMPPGALVVLNMQCEIPERTDYRFEPEIITPTRRMQSLLPLFVVGLLLAAAVILAQTTILGLWIPVRTPQQSIFPWIALILMAIWVWNSLAQPKYLRLSPGRIDVLQYSLLGRATIRPYPIEAGTIILYVDNSVSRRLELSRAGRRDLLELRFLTEAGHFRETLLKSIMSTAPTPPLSDDALVG